MTIKEFENKWLLRMRPEDQKSDWSADAHRIYWILSYDIVGDGILTEDELTFCRAW